MSRSQAVGALEPRFDRDQRPGVALEERDVRAEAADGDLDGQRAAARRRRERLPHQRRLAVAARRDQEDLLAGQQVAGQPVELGLAVDERRQPARPRRRRRGWSRPVTSTAVTVTDLNVTAATGGNRRRGHAPRSPSRVQTARSCGSQAGSDCQPAPPGSRADVTSTSGCPTRRRLGGAERGAEQHAVGRHARRRSPSTAEPRRRPGRLCRAGMTPGGSTKRDGQPGSRGTTAIEQLEAAGAPAASVAWVTSAGAGPSDGPGARNTNGKPAAGPTARRRAAAVAAGVQPAGAPGCEVEPRLDRANLPDRRRAAASAARARAPERRSLV